MWQATILAAALTAAPLYAARCAACHQGSEVTAGLPQGIRALGAIDLAPAGRFVTGHLEAMTGRVPEGDEAQRIVKEIRVWPLPRAARGP